MEFFTDDQNILKEFRFDPWDRRALGQENIDKFEDFIGKNYEKLILFILKNELFLKLRSRLCHEGEKPTYFWGKDGDVAICPPPSRVGTPKYARIYLTATDDSDFVSILHSNRLVKSKYEPEILKFELEKEKIINISFKFNIARNFRNAFYSLTKKDPDDRENDEAKTVRAKELVFRAVDESGAIKILDKEEVENITPEELSKYKSLRYAMPYSKPLKRKAEEIKNNLKEIKQNNKELFPEVKKKRKSKLEKVKDWFLSA